MNPCYNRLNIVLFLIFCIFLLSGCRSLSNPSGSKPLPSPTPSSTISSLSTSLPNLDFDKPSDKAIDGLVTNISKDSLVITTTLGSKYTVTLTPQTQIWKGGWSSGLPIEMKDHIDITGNVNHSTKIVTAEKIWVNIVSLSGVISNIKWVGTGTLQFNLRDVRYGTFLVKLSPSQKVLPPNGNREVPIDEIQWDKVKFADVVGLVLKDGLVQPEHVSVSYE